MFLDIYSNVLKIYVYMKVYTYIYRTFIQNS